MAMVDCSFWRHISYMDARCFMASVVPVMPWLADLKCDVAT